MRKLLVMAGLVPAIHVFTPFYDRTRKTWMPGTRPGMTDDGGAPSLLPDPSLLARLQPRDVFTVHVEQQQGQHREQ